MKNPFSKKPKNDGGTGESAEKNGSGFSGFAEKVGRFFSPEPQKEKVLRHEDFQAAGDVYYATVSAGYKVAQRFLWLLFIVFMLASIIFNYKEITYNNFFYLMRDFSSAVDAETTNYETVSYESSPGQHFSLYRGGVAVVSPSRVSAFTATGRRTLEAESDFSAPFVVCSDQYMLVYDTAGKTFTVYNSFAKIYTETLSHPITGASFAEDGSFAVITRDASYRAVVHIYYPEENFKYDIYRWNGYMFDVAMDAKRDLVAFVYYGAGNGTGETLISLRRKSTLKEITTIQLAGEFPLDCGFMDNDNFAVITDGAVRIFDESFEETVAQSYEYRGGNVTGYFVGDQGVAVSAMISSKNEVIAFDKTGNLLYNDIVQTSVTDVAVFSHYVFLQNETGVTRLNTQTKEEETLACGSGKMLLYNSHTAVICGESKAEYLVFSNQR